MAKKRWVGEEECNYTQIKKREIECWDWELVAAHTEGVQRRAIEMLLVAVERQKWEKFTQQPGHMLSRVQEESQETVLQRSNHGQKIHGDTSVDSSVSLLIPRQKRRQGHKIQQ